MSLAISSTLGSHTGLAIQQAIGNQIESDIDTKSIVDAKKDGKAADSEVREAFQEFVGKTFYGQLLKSMRKSVGKPAYFHGGRGEEVFRSQLDQIVVERISETSAGPLADSMYGLTALSPRR
jgi:hypothetical protein